MKRVINGKTYSKVLGIKQGSLLTAGKDGDIEEYKADPTDAGKVLTVGEDGSVAPAESGGSEKLYSHLVIATCFTTGSPYGMGIFYTKDSTPFTRATFIEYIKSKSNSTATGYAANTLPAIPVPASSATKLIVGFSASGNDLYLNSLEFNGTNFSPNSYTVDNENKFSDTVTEV